MALVLQRTRALARHRNYLSNLRGEEDAWRKPRLDLLLLMRLLEDKLKAPLLRLWLPNFPWYAQHTL